VQEELGYLYCTELDLQGVHGVLASSISGLSFVLVIFVCRNRS